MISGKAKLAGVIGNPVEHSLSPILHNYWIPLLHLDAVYIPLTTDKKNFKSCIKSLVKLGFQGLNVTLPFKELALSVADEVEPSARDVGAANTLVFRDEKIIAQNTDVTGFLENLKELADLEEFKNTSCVVLGAGGAARAVCHALKALSVENICIVNRDKARADNLGSSLKGLKTETYDWENVGAALEGAHLVVNASSLGMVNQPPLFLDLEPLAPEAKIMDLVYTPQETDLLKLARDRDIDAVGGLTMLIEQARPGFEAWFGAKPPFDQSVRDVMELALLDKVMS